MEEKKKQPEISKNKPTQFIINGKTLSLYGLALNLGYMIVIPVLVFGIGGVILDKKLDSFPIFVMIGFFLAMTSALTIVFVKMKQIMASIKKNSEPTGRARRPNEDPAMSVRVKPSLSKKPWQNS